MLRLFESATLKLTGWYLLILMITTSLFSVIIYRMATVEVSGRLESLELRLENDPGWPFYADSLRSARLNQEREAKQAIFFGLFYTNLAIWLLGGFGSYLLARRTLEPIQDIHEAQSRFTSDASHELKTPLAVMKSELELALRDPNMKKTEYKEVISSSLEEVNKLTDLTHGLLQMSRLDYGAIALDEKVNITKELDKVKKLLDDTGRVVIEAPKIEVIQLGNISLLRDVFVVILDNALRYSPATTTVSIVVKSSTKKSTIIVSNEGEGILEKDIAHVFDRFYRADYSRSIQNGTKSYGLGLAVAKKIIDLHQGDISVVSKPGKLTSVTISLPKL